MALLRRILALGRRAQLDREIEDELREHMQMCIDDSLAAGMSREEAERKARLRFGNAAVTRERVVAEDAALGLDSLFRDLRFAVRGFVKTPAFTNSSSLSITFVAQRPEAAKTRPVSLGPISSTTPAAHTASPRSAGTTNTRRPMSSRASASPHRLLPRA